MTITLQNSAGATPTGTASINIPFRIKSGTAAASILLGRTEYGSATAATTLTLDSGATLGMTNSIEATLYIYAINNAGTINLGIINGQRLDESILHTSTALDGTADTASTLYSDSAITSCAVRLIGRMRHTMNAVGTYDEDPVELGILGIGGSGGGASGELASGEKIYWQDTGQYIQGDTTSITIESDDTLTINSDTLASINSTTKAEIVAPVSNVVASTSANVTSPIVYLSGNVAITHATDSHLAIGKNTWSSGYQLDIQDAAPIFRMKSSDSADDNEAKRSRFVMEGDGGEEMFKIDTKHLGTGNDAASQVIFSNRSGTATSAFMTANSLHGVTFAANVAVTGHFSVSGTTTTINSTTLAVVDPLIELQTASGGGALGSDTNKDVGLIMHYHDGSAKKAFFGWDDSAAKLTFVPDATESGTQVISGTIGSIIANAEGDTFKTDSIRRYTDSSTTTKILLNDEQLKFYAGHSSNQTLKIENNVVDCQGTLTVGGADTGYDVKLFGDTASRYWLLDTSADGVVQRGTLTVGVDDAGHDVKFFGDTASAYMLWDTSADDLILGGVAGLIVPDGKLTLGSTAVTSTAAEINLIDGGTSASPSYTIIDADRLVVNDGGTMKSTLMSDLKTYASSSPGGTNTQVQFNNSGNFGGHSGLTYVSGTGTLTATIITESSDVNLKTNITPLEGSLDKIMALQGVNFDWKEGEDNQIGLLADDVAKVVPEVVQFTDKKATALQYSKMVALLIEGMKEQQQEINELKRLIPKT